MDGYVLVRAGPWVSPLCHPASLAWRSSDSRPGVNQRPERSQSTAVLGLDAYETDTQLRRPAEFAGFLAGPGMTGRCRSAPTPATKREPVVVVVHPFHVATRDADEGADAGRECSPRRELVTGGAALGGSARLAPSGERDGPGMFEDWDGLARTGGDPRWKSATRMSAGVRT